MVVRKDDANTMAVKRIVDKVAIAAGGRGGEME